MRKMITSFCLLISTLCSGDAISKELDMKEFSSLYSQKLDLQLRARFLNDDQKINNLAWQGSKICNSLSVTAWGWARHPGGDNNGTINQHNDGIGVKCFTDENNSAFYHADSLKNSQYGNTFDFGIGKEYSVFKNNWVSAHVGGSLTFISYEIPKYGQTAYGILPIPYFGVSFYLPNKFGTIGFERMYLPLGITIDSVRAEIRREFW